MQTKKRVLLELINIKEEFKYHAITLNLVKKTDIRTDRQLNYAMAIMVLGECRGAFIEYFSKFKAPKHFVMYSIHYLFIKYILYLKKNKIIYVLFIVL